MGDGGVIIHYNGLNWISVVSPTTSNLLAVDFNSSRSRGYAVGEGGVILLFTPNTGDTSGVWTLDLSPTTKLLASVWIGRTTMWIGGAKGTILSRTPTSVAWKVTNLLTNATIVAIDGVRTDYAATALCDDGLLLRNQWGSFVIDFPTNQPLRAFALNPTYLKSGRLVGQGGIGFMLDYDLKTNFEVSTVADLNAIVIVDESIAFAFGVGGACVTGFTIDHKKWRNCSLPQPEDIYAAAVVMEGPLRLSFPAPVANLQQLTATNEWITVAQYPVVLETMNYRLSGEDVYTIDFSSFRTVGTYRFSLNGIGNSYSFQISPSALDMVAYHTCRMLYYQRSGMPRGLEVPFAEPRFSRPTDHEFNTSAGGRRNDGAYHWSIVNSSLYDGESICTLKTKVCPSNTLRDVSGGWFDAGDYGKYMPTAVSSTWRCV